MCPNCGSKLVEIVVRDSGNIAYVVHECPKCGYAEKREIIRFPIKKLKR
jgi:predicted RNA-binding Zn-ribbon protein involved in translation (DUF1610 family)